MSDSLRSSTLPAFDIAAFEHLRQRSGLVLGHPLTVFESIGSTNDEAKRAARSGVAGGALFLAEYQRQGRGRRLGRWVSAARENLLFSVLLRPDLSPRSVCALTLVVGLAVRAAVAEYGAGSAKIKWPNDVLVGRKKLAGVLVESQVRGDQLCAVVVGVGININALGFDGPLAETAVSLRALGGGVVAREPVLASVLGALEGLTRDYERGGLAGMSSALERHDALRGESISVSGVRGAGAGIDGDGALLLATEDGLATVTSGSVTWV